MNMEDDKEETLSDNNKNNQVTECNQKINKYIRFPIMTWEKIIRLVIVFSGTSFMIIGFFTGIAYSHHDIDCLDDMPYTYTESIHNFFYDHEGLCMAFKFIISFLIDILIIYTLIVWSLFGTNIRLISSGCTYMIINLLIRFLHIQKQPDKSAFTKSHIFSLFVSYQVTTYSFYSVSLGIFLICTFEWKRNKVAYMFWIMFTIMVIYIIFLIVMRGNYWHEIFTAIVFSHYFFIMNEKVLEMIKGKDYLKNEIRISSNIPLYKNTEKEEKKGNEIKESRDNEIGAEDN